MSYLTTVLADNPLHYWRLADAGGVLRYDLGSSRIHLLSANQLAPSSGPASDGGSEFFAGTSGASREVIPFNQVGSIECWFWAAQVPITDPGYLIAWDALGGGGSDIELRHRTNGKIDLWMGSALATSPAAISTQTWHHLVGTNDGATERLYLDSAQVATAAGGGTSASSKRLGFGGNLAAALTVYGWMAEIAYYTGVLSALRVAAHYSAADLKTSPPVFKGGAFLDESIGAALAIASAAATGTADAAILAAVKRTY